MMRVFADLAIVLVMNGAVWQSSVADWDGLKALALLGSEEVDRFPFRRFKESHDPVKLRRIRWECAGWLFVIFSSVCALVSLAFSAPKSWIDWTVSGIGAMAAIWTYRYFWIQKCLEPDGNEI